MLCTRTSFSVKCRLWNPPFSLLLSGRLLSSAIVRILNYPCFVFCNPSVPHPFCFFFCPMRKWIILLFLEPRISLQRRVAHQFLESFAFSFFSRDFSPPKQFILNIFVDFYSLLLMLSPLRLYPVFFAFPCFFFGSLFFDPPLYKPPQVSLLFQVSAFFCFTW